MTSESDDEREAALLTACLDQAGVPEGTMRKLRLSIANALAVTREIAAQPEQPTPTGEVTREHREALTKLVDDKELARAKSDPGRYEAWLNHDAGAPLDFFASELSLEDLAQLLATREAAAYQRGREEAQGGWAPKAGDRVAQVKLAELTTRLHAAERGMPELVDFLSRRPGAVAGGYVCEEALRVLTEATAKLEAAEGRVLELEHDAGRMHYLGGMVRSRSGDEQAELNRLMRKHPPIVEPAPEAAKPTALTRDEEDEAMGEFCENNPIGGREAAKPAECDCAHCWKQPVFGGHMVVCRVCGNKRCPKAEWHGFVCTGSNELGQVGVEEPAPPHTVASPTCSRWRLGAVDSSTRRTPERRTREH